MKSLFSEKAALIAAWEGTEEERKEAKTALEPVPGSPYWIQAQVKPFINFKGFDTNSEIGIIDAKIAATQTVELINENNWNSLSFEELADALRATFNAPPSEEMQERMTDCDVDYPDTMEIILCQQSPGVLAEENLETRAPVNA
jgi:hypothetical protein